MRHTFLPNSERTQIYREYSVRVVAIFSVAIAVAVAVGAAALFPAFMRASTVERSALDAIAAGKAGSPSDAQVMQDELSADGKLLAALSGSRSASRLSNALRQIALVRSRVSLSAISVARADAGSVDAVLQGTAPTRDELLSFKARLEGIAPGAVVDLPLSQLAQSTDISFSLHLTAKLP